jgi:ATPase family associated with various cellular activities (AAA)
VGKFLPTSPITLSNKNMSNPIMQAIDTGFSCILTSGRDLIGDIDVDPDTHKLTPLVQILRVNLRKRRKVLIPYDRAMGLDWQFALEDDNHDIEGLRTALQTHNLLDIPQDEQELSQVIRGIAEISRFSTKGGLKWSDGQSMGICFLLKFAEDLIPCTQGMIPTDNQIIVKELAISIAQSLAIRGGENVIVFQTSDPGKIDPLVLANLKHVHLQLPSKDEKIRFLQAASKLYSQATLEDGLTIENIASLTSNTPNRGMEGLYRAAHRSGRPITTKDCITQKDSDTDAASEGTFAVLDTSRVSVDTKLQGINSSHPQKILSKLALLLENGDPNMPGAVLLSGPPGTGKTDMCLVLAKQARVSAYEMKSPKRPHVGETERLAALQQRFRIESSPSIAFIDEIDNVMPMARSDHNGDSGASASISASLLTGLSNESQRGRSLLIGTTNRPDNIGSAMLSRWMIIPVLHPLNMDYPAIVISTAKRVGNITEELRDDNPMIVDSANIFYELGANPRHIRSSLSNALLLKGELNPETILFAAKDCTISGDRISAIYSDLLAIAACTSKSYFPWFDCLATYPFPAHLQGLVDLQTGNINRLELQNRIQELKPNANV